MSDIPNPLGAFDIFNSRFEGHPKKLKKNKAEAIKKISEILEAEGKGKSSDRKSVV